MIKNATVKIEVDIDPMPVDVGPIPPAKETRYRVRMRFIMNPSFCGADRTYFSNGKNGYTLHEAQEMCFALRQRITSD